MLFRSETIKEKLSFDTVGLALLILFVGALQLVLDLGREHDWFADTMIVSLSAVSAIAFALFIAWELTEKTPIVDLRVFRHRGFAAAVLAQSFGYAVFFATLVLIPQYLQTSLGYTATTEIYTTVYTLSLHDALPIFLPAGISFCSQDRT